MTDFVADQLKQLGLQRIGFEATNTTYEQYQNLKGKLNGIELVPATDIFSDLRLIKTPEEVEKIRQACRLADQCFDHVLRLIQPGVSEWDIGLEIEFFFRRNMADLSFAPIVASGYRSALPHGRASDKKLEPGDFVTLDFGAKLDGYCSDITRTMVLSPVTDRHKEIYGKVLEAQLAALAFMKPGVTAHDVDAAARNLLAGAGLAQYFGHGLGHGLGRNVHDGGRLGMNSKTVLEPGQIWTVEPGVYIEGFGGVRIEDDVVVTETGVEILTKSTKELLVLPK
jgi:Xaa-Pro aminopeptidase